MGAWGIGPWEGDTPYDVLGTWAEALRQAASASLVEPGPDAKRTAVNYLLGKLEQAGVPALASFDEDDEPPLTSEIDAAAMSWAIQVAFASLMASLGNMLTARDEPAALALGALMAQARVTVPEWPAPWWGTLNDWDAAEPDMAKGDAAWRTPGRANVRRGVRQALELGQAPPTSDGLLAKVSQAIASPDEAAAIAKIDQAYDLLHSASLTLASLGALHDGFDTALEVIAIMREDYRAASGKP